MRPIQCIVALALMQVLIPSALPATADHWAFQPIGDPAIPQPDGETTLNPVDAFIRQKLNETGLTQAPPADRVTLIRRLFLDLHGLPPSPGQIEAFAQSTDPDACARLVDELLASPRYGERWAQHWLDIVRYADTDGYEVNTPRPNAWPYRDYVIRALNEDKPYDRFVFEQLAGDAVQEDAANGFLVAAAVLLPGQIGKDDASIRLARQDALDEIISATSETFLGLSVSCARCHDHKFDPITQRDYYSMQAFFSGVDYGDRPLRQPGHQAKLEQASHTVDLLRQELRRFDIPAFTGSTILIDDEDPGRVTHLKPKQGHGTNPEGTGRGYRDDRGSLDRVANFSGGRYTWWNHSPGENILTYNPSARGNFRVWISWGVHGSGVHTRDARYLLDLDGRIETTGDQKQIAVADQYYFANVNSGTSEHMPLWSGLLDAGVHQLNSESLILLRGGDTGTGVTADILILQEAAGTGPAHPFPILRPPVNHHLNIEQFPPTPARLVRFITLATQDNNRHEPCLDELEIFKTGTSQNLALAANGSIPASSGDYHDPLSHRLEHINNGQYGNSQSWISDRHGGGWVQIELPQTTSIDRIAWARDRNRKFTDRLPTRYRIDVSVDSRHWTTVASSEDREPFGTPSDELLSLARRLPAGEAGTLLKKLDAALKEQKELSKGQLVYAGTFRSPDPAHLLHRGNPEQKRDRVGPAVPASLGNLNLQPDLDEQSRRIALANWIIAPDNPLTARVMANRIWQYHFGTGLVDTPSDFGLNGARPTHPELLDFLARELIRNNGSIKHLHRLILLSQTYRQSSRIDPRARAVDAGSRLLWRFPPRRLEAEAIRDSLLLVSGRLNPKAGGPGFDFFKSRGGLSGFPPVEEFTDEQRRRMIYSHKIRMERVPVFGAFDCPDAGRAMPRRSQSMTAIQALNLFNSSFLAGEAAAFAGRVETRVLGIEPRIRRAFQLALGRTPSPIEAEAAQQVARDHGLAAVCRALFNSSEFLFIP